jgi:DNA-binding NarL/FixJ family response regulator
MQLTTVLLINSLDPHWARLQAMLRKQRCVQVIGEARRRGEALQMAKDEQPEVIFAGSDLPDLPLIPLVEGVRAHSPASQIVVVGRLLSSSDHVRLIHLGVSSFLLWKDISEETLRPILEAIRHDLRVASKAAADRCGDLDCRREPQTSDIALKPLDHAILNGLAKELTQQQIAEVAGAGLRTVEEHIAILKDKLEAPTPFMLGMKAERFGFLR